MSFRKILFSLIKITLGVLALGVFLLMSVAPWLESVYRENEELIRRLDQLRQAAMETLVTIWFFTLGSMVGSFINVVVWRMPRGVSVVSSGSACPKCKQSIRLVDNLPILGWLKLGGRCRVCQLPISSRYPIVEMIFGFVFLALFFAQLQTAGGNLPGASTYRNAGILQVVIETKWDVVATCAWHTLMLVMLMTWSLMAYDESRIPAKTVVFTMALGILGPLLLPGMYPVKWVADHQEWFAGLPLLNQIATGLLGAVSGFLLGSCFELLFKERLRIGIVVGMTTIGVFLGWQALLTILGLFGICLLVFQHPTRSGNWPVVASLTVATLVHHLFWFWFDQLTHSINWPIALAITLVVGLVLSGVVGRLPKIERVAPRKLEELPVGVKQTDWVAQHMPGMPGEENREAASIESGADDDRKEMPIDESTQPVQQPES